MRGRAANAALMALWRERIGRWRSSGLSISEFCRREEISQPSFFRCASGWRAVARNRRDSSSCRRCSWPAIAGVQIACPAGRPSRCRRNLLRNW